LTIGRVVGSGCVAVERPNTVGRVPRAPVEKECRVTGSCVLGAGHVGKERERSVGRVPVAICIGLERRMTVGRIGGAVREAEEGIVTLGGVFVGIPPSGGGLTPKAFGAKPVKQASETPATAR